MTVSRSPHPRRIVAALTAALAMAACGGTSRAPAGSAARPATVTDSALDAIARARADSARRVYTDADVHFMSAMIGHHAQAIVMSRMAQTHGASASIRTLAERIVNAQEDEIAIMQQWLRERGKPVPEARPGPMKMTMHGVEHEMRMPGMLTDAQMKQLDEARGTEFDRLFLTFMIQHHKGAIAMVKELFGSHGAAQDDVVFKLASDVNVDQTTEVARMQQMLFQLMVQGRSQ